MQQKSRTAKSFKNSIIAMGFLLVNILLQFYSRKIFLQYLGTEILGLNTTAQNILQFLNIAELGIGAAVGFALFRPLAVDDRRSINEIIALMGHLYRRIALFILAGAIIISAFFPLIFAKTPLPLWYAYGSFYALLLSALLGYFVNFRQVILTSAQMDYKIQYATNSWTLLKIALQVVAMIYLSNPYVWWLILEVVFALISAATLHRVTMHSFPYLNGKGLRYADLRMRYSEIIVKIRQLFVHKIGVFALTQSSTLVIYAYSTLTEVALYGNYMILILGIQRLSNAVFNSLGGGVGNLIAEGDKDRIISVFRELFSVRFAYATIVIFSVFTCAQPMISLWIGPQYLFPLSTVALICGTLYIGITRNTVDLYINAYGLFSDIWAPVVEAILNIGLSVLLGYFFGINGILSGVLISQIIIMIGWKPYFLFSRGLKTSLWLFWRDYIIQIAAALAATFPVIHLIAPLLPDPFSGWISLILFASGMIISYSIAVCTLLCAVRSGLCLFVARIRSVIHLRK